MTSKERNSLLALAKLMDVQPSKRSVSVPAEVLTGIAKTLKNIAGAAAKETIPREGLRQIWRDPSSHYMAVYHHNRRAF